MNKTQYYYDFVDYFNRAKILNQRNIGILPINTLSGDELQDNVTIYDTVWRRYAGFSKVLEQLWYGPESWTKRKSTMAYRDFLSMNEWLYICLVHRLTGSGASFEADHGYRNTLLIEMVETKVGMNEYIDFIKNYNKPFFTSKGNQIPPFNKPSPGWDKAGREFICVYAPKLANYITNLLKTSKNLYTIQQLVDIVLNWMTENGFKRYKFVLTAWVMDMAEYYPEYVDQNSHCYMGKNAIESINYIFKIEKQNQQSYDEVMDYVCKELNSKPYDMEDCFCDFIRYVENYIPKNYTKHYKRLSLRVETQQDIHTFFKILPYKNERK